MKHLIQFEIVHQKGVFQALLFLTNLIQERNYMGTEVLKTMSNTRYFSHRSWWFCNHQFRYEIPRGFPCSSFWTFLRVFWQSIRVKLNTNNKKYSWKMLNIRRKYEYVALEFCKTRINFCVVRLSILVQIVATYNV